MVVEADDDRDIGVHEVALRRAREDLSGQLVVTRLGQGEWALVLTAIGREWHGTGGDLFDALRDLRLGMDRDGIVIGLNGARPECSVSGMLADMGEGRHVYVLTLPKTDGRLDMLGTLTPSPLSEVSNVADQDAHKRRWLP